MAPGIWQILIIVVLVVLLFGAGRISGLMGEVAKGITSFRKGLKEGAEGEEETDSASGSIEADAPAEDASASREEETTRN
ncbi:twin-arginine translocase TatA/TatE family subunit [Hyphobacterium sp. HN65]|uniref:Sec-independent protein translocase protein TatA n=1 Tax=Hyphobacterium lacteum TaxID=3116575 RepID=A0ABU7LTA6_9PROT|nr:twin-arginine translocase TatA/TatE family subunit [Hyphobacterium sp. HN65]MEE2527138.1 twin-arginine translocase TatA/TatE family subunit [Hyphobacterium sp. HN65]